MPKLKPKTEAQRRDRILDAAELCFARAGFHRTTMQDICREAGISPGALYVYFDSKEDLIAGLCERDRAEFQARFQMLATAPDLLGAMEGIGRHYFVDDPVYKRQFAVEMSIEATRNPRIAEIFFPTDDLICQSFEQLFQALKDAGRIAPALDIPTLARLFHVMADGMFWRRAIDPKFEGHVILPAMVQVFGQMLNILPAAALISTLASHRVRLATDATDTPPSEQSQ